MNTEISQADRQMARREQMLHELMSDLTALVEANEITDQQANEWYNDKADQWAQE